MFFNIFLLIKYASSHNDDLEDFYYALQDQTFILKKRSSFKNFKRSNNKKKSELKKQWRERIIVQQQWFLPYYLRNI